MAEDDGGLRAAWFAMLALVPIFGAACWKIRRDSVGIRLEDLRVPLLPWVPLYRTC